MIKSLRIKFTVIKNVDVLKHLTPIEQDVLSDMLIAIQGGRKAEGKTPTNQYIVINTDEPYIDEIIDIMKKNGHWG